MKTKYKFIHFVETTWMKKPMWNVVNNKSNSILGHIVFYPDWKKWVFSQAGANILFSDYCLDDISDFQKQLQKK